MSSFSERIISGFKRFLPNPFTIAIILTVFTLGLAYFLTKPDETSGITYLWTLVDNWEKGLWDGSGGGLYFAFQMMLMLVLGHCLALTSPVKSLINRLTSSCTNSANSAAIVAFSAIVTGLFNWGLGLIFGAILARSIGEKFARNSVKLNYGLIGASAYLGLLVWHGGLSGSAPTKVMESGYLQELMSDVSTPSEIPFETTIGSLMNLIMSIIALIIFPLLVYFLGKKSKDEAIPTIDVNSNENTLDNTKKNIGAEKLDASKYIGLSIGVLLLLVALFKAFNYEGNSTFGFIQPNYINLFMLGLCLSFHQSINQFLSAIQQAIGDISGILIQFPLYFGILGIMKSSGLIVIFSDMLINLANATSLPIYTFISAGIVNFFVPSGGGQWAIQGPILIQTAKELGADLPKTIMALAYGDQLTNMLQPFWALPLLGITRLKAHEILPYTFIFFIVGAIVYGSVLLFF